VETRYDVVVVGGGAAGLSGALALARARRSVLVVDAGQPRNATAGQVHNYLSRDGTAPGELLEMGREEVVRHGGEIVAGWVDAAAKHDDGFLVTFHDGRAVRARRLLVTTGLVDQLPDVPGVAQRWGRDVLHCPHCSGWEVRDRRIGVLATGPMSAHRAAMWRQWSPHVVLLLHGTQAPTGEEAEWMAALGIPVAHGPVVDIVVADDALTAVRMASGAVVALDVMVVAPRYTARADVLATLGLEPVNAETAGHVIGSHMPTGAAGATTLPGVWVAGNVADVHSQVIIAAAAGLNAGIAINADLVAEDTRTAVAAHRTKTPPPSDWQGRLPEG
jgi:thioredoxin reductase